MTTPRVAYTRTRVYRDNRENNNNNGRKKRKKFGRQRRDIRINFLFSKHSGRYVISSVTPRGIDDGSMYIPSKLRNNYAILINTAVV